MINLPDAFTNYLVISRIEVVLVRNFSLFLFETHSMIPSVSQHQLAMRENITSNESE